MALIEIQNVDKIYNTSAVPVHAVKNVSQALDVLADLSGS